MPAQGNVDPNAPNSKTMHRVNNKNNIADMHLRRLLGQFEREKSVTITNIDHDRLDIRDFLKQVQKCESDELPESKRWLGEKDKHGRRRIKPRDLATAPTGEGAKKKTDERNVRTAPSPKLKEDQKNAAAKALEPPKPAWTPKVYVNPFAHRPRPSIVPVEVDGDVWGDDPFGLKPRPPATTENPEEQSKSPSVQILNVAGKEIDVVAAENQPTDAVVGQKTHLLDVIAESDPQRVKSGKLTREARSFRQLKEDFKDPDPGKGEDGGFMREMLDTKAKQRRRRRRRHEKPLSQRINEFYDKIDTLKLQQDEDMAAPPTWESQRAWTLLTKGINAALAESSDEEENKKNTT